MARNPLVSAPKSHLLALEPRIMFDAAAPAMVHNAFETAFAQRADRASFSSERPDRQVRTDVGAAVRSADVAGDAHRARTGGRQGERSARTAGTDLSTPRAEPSVTLQPQAAASHQVIFIDTSVPDYQQLARDWATQGEVILIDKDADGLAQMQAALAGRSDVTAIHIVSHGEEGDLLIGSTKLDEASITGAQAQSLAAIGRSLAAGGDILVYGCDFAEGADGARALESLATATGADVAASTDLTGAEALGGDWTLEAHQGLIQARTLSDTDWAHTLDPGPVNAVPISVAADSLTVTDGTGAVVASGSTGFTQDNNTRSPNVGAGATARWANAATQNGQSYDLVATIMSISTADTVRFLRPTGQTPTNKPGDDPTFLLVDNSGTNNSTGDGATVQIQWTLVLTGTNTVAPADVTFNILDIDGRNGQPNSRESVAAQASQLDYYTHETNSDIVFNFDTSSGTVTASGTQDENNPIPTNADLSTKSQASFSYKNTSGFTLTYSLAAANTVTRQAQFYQDGDSDFVYTTPVYASIPRLDLDGDDSTAAGTGAHFTFTEKGASTPVVDSDVLVTNPEAVDSIVSGSVTLTNAKAGDVLSVGTLPSNITATVSNAGGQITVSLTGAGSETDYEAAYRAITFSNTSAAPDATQRVLTVAFTNDTNYGTSATTLIDVVPVNDAPVNTLPSSYTVAEDGGALALSGVSVSDVDAGTGALTITLSVPSGAGVLSAATAGGVTASGSGGRTITLNGTLDALNTYLAGASTRPTFTSAPDYNGAVTLTMVTNDNGNTGSGGSMSDTDTSTITVTPVNDAPVNTLPSSYTVAEDGGALALSGVSVSDVDAGTGALTLTLSVPSGAGTLAAATAGGVTATGSGGRTITLNGTLSALNIYLAGSTTRPTFTSAPDYNGAVTLTMVTNDNGNTGAGGPMSDTDTSTITVTPVNDAPRTVGTLPDQSAQDAQAVRYTTAGGFTDVEGDALTYSASGLPAGLSIDPASGVISGTLDRSASQASGGAYAVVVTATDPSRTSATQSFGITVTNPAPTARPDQASTVVNTPVTIAVLTNDTDPDGDPLAVTAVGAAAHGAVVRNADGTLTYTPTAGYAGADSFTYTISDGQGGVSASTVTVNVSPAPNGAPTARPDQASTTAGAPVTIPVLANDTDPDGDPLSVTAVGAAAHGTAVRNADGTLTYTPTAGYTGSDSFTYAISDGRGGVATSTVDVTVAPAPDGAPTARPDQAATSANTPVIIAVLANDTDPDGDPLTVTAVGAAAHGAVARNADGTLIYTPTAGYTGADSFTYAISDGRGGVSSSTVTVNVSPAPNAAPTARPDQATTSANTPVTIAVLGNDTDPDGDPLSVTAVNAAAHGAVMRNADGTVTYMPTTGYTGADSFTYAISDGRGGVSASTVTVNVSPAPNGSPTARPDQASTSADTPVTVAVLANDTDPDGDPLMVTAVGAAAHGSVARNPDGTLTYTPITGYAGADSFTYTVSDGRGGVSTSTVDVTVAPAPNSLPTAQPDQAATTANTPVTIAVLANDTDPDGDPLAVMGVGAPAHGAVAQNADGTLTYTPTTGYAGADSFTYTVSDGRGGVSTSTVDVTVAPAPNGPPNARPDQASTPVNTPVTIAVLANDTDPDGDPLAVMGVGAPAHGAVAQNADGTLTYTPITGYAGPDSFTYTVSDGRGGVSTSTVDVTVAPAPNGPPNARPDQASTPVNTPVTIAVLANDIDPDDDPLAVTAVGAATHGAVVRNTDGTLTYTPTAGYAGADSFTYTISDGRGGVSTSTVDVTITAASNGAPTARPDQASTTANTPVLVAVLANDTDPDGDPLSVAAVGAAAHGAVMQNADGTLTYTPNAGYAGADSFTYTISDGRGGVSTSTVDVTVSPAPDRPTAPRSDEATTLANTPVTIPLLAGGGTTQAPDTVGAVDGAVKVNADGTLTYTPRPNFTGVDTITYTVADGLGGVSTFTIAVRVSSRTADIDELLQIGRVRAPDTAPVALAAAVEDRADGRSGDVAWLSVRDAVAQARPLNSTALGTHAVRDAVDGARSLYGTSIDAAGPVAGEARRIQDRADFRDAGDRAFDPRWGDFVQTPLSGFSVAAGGEAQVMFQSVVRGGAIYLDVCDTAADGRAPISGFAVLSADGGPLPDWIKVDPRGLAIIERPADVDELHFVLEVRRGDGGVSRTRVVIQGATGVIELDRRDVGAPPPADPSPARSTRPVQPHRAGRPRAAPLDATLSTSGHRRHAEAADLWRDFK